MNHHLRSAQVFSRDFAVSKVAACEFFSGRLIGDVNIALETRQLLTSFLQMALLSDDLISACSHDPDASFANLVRDHDKFSDSLLTVITKCVRDGVTVCLVSLLFQ